MCNSRQRVLHFKGKIRLESKCNHDIQKLNCIQFKKDQKIAKIRIKLQMGVLIKQLWKKLFLDIGQAQLY